MDTEPRVVTVLREFRQALDGKEEGLMLDMARHWLDIERRLEADISALAYEMARRRDAGEVVSQQLVWKAERYQKIKGQLAEQIKAYNQNYAIDAVERAQREYSLLGLASAQNAIAAGYERLGVGPMWNRLNIGAVESMIGLLGNGSPLNTLLKNSYPEAVDGLSAALINGLARGLGPAEIARMMTDGMGMGLDRALLIARTEAARAYRSASVMQYRESGVVRGFLRLVKKSTACMACLMLDGEWFELEDDLDDHPRGKCMPIPAVVGVNNPRWEKGPAYFAGLSPEEQRARMGAERYQLWKDGQIKLTDLVQKSHSDEWGDAPRVTGLAELRQAAGA